MVCPEREREPDRAPQHALEPDREKRCQDIADDILAPSQASIEEGKAWRHEEHQGSAQQHEGCICVVHILPSLLVRHAEIREAFVHGDHREARRHLLSGACQRHFGNREMAFKQPYKMFTRQPKGTKAGIGGTNAALAASGCGSRGYQDFLRELKGKAHSVKWQLSDGLWV